MSKNVIEIAEEKELYYTFPCPHCHQLILVHKLDINCEIFRHGAWKDTGYPIPPHAKYRDIEEWRLKDKFNGCGKPFRLTKKGEISICDYI
jgi:hypothetical protein